MLAVERLATVAVPRRSPRSATSFYTGCKEEDGPVSDGPVRVYATGNPFDGQLTKGHLEAEGIAVMMKGEGEGPYPTGPVYLWVAPENERRAREIIDAIESGAYSTSDEDVLGENDVPNEQPQR